VSECGEWLSEWFSEVCNLLLQLRRTTDPSSPGGWQQPSWKLVFRLNFREIVTLCQVGCEKECAKYTRHSWLAKLEWLGDSISRTLGRQKLGRQSSPESSCSDWSGFCIFPISLTSFDTHYCIPLWNSWFQLWNVPIGDSKFHLVSQGLVTN
jgi:hypothetical protein